MCSQIRPSTRWQAIIKRVDDSGAKLRLWTITKSKTPKRAVQEVDPIRSILTNDTQFRFDRNHRVVARKRKLAQLEFEKPFQLRELAKCKTARRELSMLSRGYGIRYKSTFSDFVPRSPTFFDVRGIRARATSMTHDSLPAHLNKHDRDAELLGLPNTSWGRNVWPSKRNSEMLAKRMPTEEFWAFDLPVTIMVVSNGSCDVFPYVDKAHTPGLLIMPPGVLRIPNVRLPKGRLDEIRKSPELLRASLLFKYDHVAAVIVEKVLRMQCVFIYKGGKDADATKLYFVRSAAHVKVKDYLLSTPLPSSESSAPSDSVNDPSPPAPVAPKTLEEYICPIDRYYLPATFGSTASYYKLVAAGSHSIKKPGPKGEFESTGEYETRMRAYKEERGKEQLSISEKLSTVFPQEPFWVLDLPVALKQYDADHH